MPTEFKINRLADIPLEPLSLLLWGPAKSGKTHLIGTLGKRTLIIDTGNGLSTLSDPKFIEKFPDASQIMVESVREKLNGYVPDKALGFDEVKNVIERYIKNASSEFDNIVIDDATAWSRLAMFKAFEINQVMLPAGNAKVRADNLNTIMPTVNEYRVAMEQMLQGIIAVLDLCKASGKNFILTAHERRNYVQKKAIADTLVLDKIMPWFQGVDKNPDGVAGLFDLVWYTEVQGKGSNKAYQVRTRGDDARTVGSRFQGVFTDLITNANLSTLFNQINEARKVGVKTTITPFTKQ